MAQAQNNSLVKITETINNIIEELDAFSENVNTAYTLAGSVAVYLFVYSLYVNERDADKKKIIKRKLNELPEPNDIDIIIYTNGLLPKEKFNAYKKKNPIRNNNTISTSMSIKGLPIERRENPIFKIDLIIINPNEPNKEKKKKEETEDPIQLTFTHNGIEKEFSIVHPQNLIRLYKSDRDKNEIKRSVLEDLNKMKLLPEKEKPVSRYAARAASMRGLSFGNANSPSSERKSSIRRMSFGNANSPGSATKRKNRNSGNLQSHSTPKTKKPSLKRSFSFGSNSS